MFRGPRDYSRSDMKQFGGHKDEVNCVAFSSDFQIMVTGCDDERVRVFNADTGTLVCKLKGHTGAVKSVCVGGDSKTFASGSYDKTVRIWQTSDGMILHVLEGHTKSVEVVVYSPDSSQLCSGSWDRTAILWDVQMYKFSEIKVYTVWQTISQPSSKPRAPVKNGYLLKVFEGHENLVQSIAFSLDGRYLATGSWDFTVRLWTLNSHDGLDRVTTLRGHKGNVHAVAFSKDGMLASGSWDKTVKLWNPHSGKVINTLSGHEGWVQALSFSPDGIYVASACDDDSVRVWDIVSGKCIKILEGQTDTAQHCAFTTSGALVASGSAGLTVLTEHHRDDPS